jgi:mRNA interferase MazF
MANYRYGDIVLLDYPYSERRVSKRRPAIILVQDRDRDLLVARITSKVYEGLAEVSLQDWQDAGLNVPSRVRLAKLAIVGELDVIRPVGKLSARDQTDVFSMLKRFIDSIGPA